MTDIHSHILPAMDDGSRDAAESLSLLRALKAQGVGVVAATPHFYAEENSPAEFLARRGEATARLSEVWEDGLPAVKRGAEVCYFEGICQCDSLDDLKIEDTDILLLEMPFRHWDSRMLGEVRELQARPDTTVLLAHIERYLRWQEPGIWDALAGWGVRNQCNASFFLHWRTKRRALRMLRAGKIHLLGSDCHDMEHRPPRMDEAMAALGEEGRAVLEENSRALLPRWKEMGA